MSQCLMPLFCFISAFQHILIIVLIMNTIELQFGAELDEIEFDSVVELSTYRTLNTVPWMIDVEDLNQKLGTALVESNKKWGNGGNSPDFNTEKNVIFK